MSTHTSSPFNSGTSGSIQERFNIRFEHHSSMYLDDSKKELSIISVEVSAFIFTLHSLKNAFDSLMEEY